MKMKCIDENKKEDSDGFRAPSIIEVTSPKDGEGIFKLGSDSNSPDKSRLIEMIKVNSETSPLHVQAEASRSNSSRIAVFEQEDSIPDPETSVKGRKTTKLYFTKSEDF